MIPAWLIQRILDRIEEEEYLTYDGYAASLKSEPIED
jgi:hypothetical protein